MSTDNDRNGISEKDMHMSQGVDEDDTRVSPAFEGVVNVLVMTAGLALIAFSIYGLLNWGT